MNAVLGYCKAILGRGKHGMNFVMNHAPGAGSIARPVDQQSSTLPLCYGCHYTNIFHPDYPHPSIASQYVALWPETSTTEHQQPS